MRHLHPNKNPKYLLLISCILWSTCSMALFAQSGKRVYRPFLFSLKVEEVTRSVPDIKTEIETIVSAQELVNDSLLQEARYWNSAYPSYRWHQIMVEAGKRTKGHKNGGRMAILHLAIYDALAEVWKHKQGKERLAPFQEHSQIEKWGSPVGYSSYICEYSAVAAAAQRVIGYYFPEEQAFLDNKLKQFKKARLRSGLQYPNDIEMGMAIGANIAEKYIGYAKTDRTDKVWNGAVPDDKTLWSGKPGKWDPMKRQWKPFTLLSADQFRPAPPPSDWSSEMEELRQFNKNHQSSDIAWKWKSEPVWDLLLERKILEYGLDPFQAAQASALFHTARFDATIAAWDGKYHFWGIRPFQYDPDFKPILIETPNFPGYPAGHTTVAGALSTTLTHLFPLDAPYFQELAIECSESRFEGGVHFRTDNEVGLKVGEKVGRQVIEKFLE
ncbi:vanadium-dependent haloperoxidase [Aggregatimonas sangjinii]|nr:vanadium-dependent haloperoxidase [Aggregatimonas sangjinii]